MAFSAGETYKIKDVRKHDGAWYATETKWGILWFPLSSTDWTGAPGAQDEEEEDEEEDEDFRKQARNKTLGGKTLQTFPQVDGVSCGEF